MSFLRRVFGTQAQAAKHYSSVEFGISFHYPTGWEIVQENASAGGWQVPVSVARYEGDVVAAGVTVNVRQHPKVARWKQQIPSGNVDLHIIESVDEILQQMDNENAVACPNYKRLAGGETTLAGVKAIKIAYTYGSDGERVFEQIVTAPHGMNEYQIICEASESRRQEFGQDFDAILNSFAIQR